MKKILFGLLISMISSNSFATTSKKTRLYSCSTNDVEYHFSIVHVKLRTSPEIDLIKRVLIKHTYYDVEESTSPTENVYETSSYNNASNRIKISFSTISGFGTMKVDGKLMPIECIAAPK